MDSVGRVDLDAFAAAVRQPGVAVAALQSANHEVGTRQPIEAAAEACGDVPLFVDAAASIGHDAVPAGWSALAASAHKWGGPAGVGLLAVRKGTRIAPAWPMDEREDGLSPGFPDVPSALAAAAALQARLSEAEELNKQHRAWIDEVRRRVAADIPDVEVVGDPDDRLPHILTFSCLYVDGEALVTALDAEGFAVSSGSACTSSTLQALACPGRDGRPDSRQRPHLPDADHDLCGDRPVLRGGAGRGPADPGGGGDVNVDLDCRGLLCPLPVIKLAKTLPTVAVGDTVTVLADDPAAATDIPAWCRMRSQELVSAAENTYVVRRVS